MKVEVRVDPGDIHDDHPDGCADHLRRLGTAALLERRTVIVGPLLAILVVALPLLARAYDHLWLITACRSWANLAPDSEPALR